MRRFHHLDSANHGTAPALRAGATLLALLAAAACGGESKPAEPQAAPTPSAETEKPAPAAPAAPAAAPAPAAPVVAKPEADGMVHISSSDLMRYTATRIEAPAGKIKVEMKNGGALPKEVMGHNFTVLKPGTDVMAFAAKAMPAKATDYVPADATEVIAHTKLLGPGESEVLELDLQAGTYPFLCTFPGHVGLMNGQLVVVN
jgi:azurin